MITPDPQLVERLRRNDKSAFDALYRNYHLAVYRNIFRVTKNADIAEDILQEVYVRLWEKRKQFDPKQSISNWLFVISFNLSIDYCRKKLREQTMHRELLLSDTPDKNPSDALRIVEDQYNLLEQAIKQLPPQRRKVVKLCKLERKTYDEAAAELQISRNTVKDHLSAAMISMNDYIRKHANQAFLFAFLFWLHNRD